MDRRTYSKEVVSEIKRVLKEKGPLTFRQVSKLTDIPESTVWKYLNKHIKTKRRVVKVTDNLKIVLYSLE